MAAAVVAAAGQPLYAQYGCGTCAPDGWLNFDASLRLRLERTPLVRGILRHSVGQLFPDNLRYGDIVAGLPLGDAMAAGVYCSHVLEHLPREAIARALAETWRILVPGGRFRLVVPDLHWRAVQYVEAASRSDTAAADRFLDASGLGARQRSHSGMAILRHVFGRSAHLWMYDFAALHSLLEAAGFVAIRRCRFGDAGDPMFDLVEDRSRFFADGREELAIEARRPPAAHSAEC